MPRYLTRREVAEEYPISYSSLAHMAMRGEGPPYSRIGKRAIYKTLDVDRWIERHQINTTVDMPHLRGRPRRRLRFVSIS